MYCMFRANGIEQLCCYNKDKLLLPFNSMGGHMSRFSSATHPAQYLLLDHLPYLMCANFSNNAQKYNELRPTDNCIGYKLPARGESVHKDTVVFLLLPLSPGMRLAMHGYCHRFIPLLSFLSMRSLYNQSPTPIFTVVLHSPPNHFRSLLTQSFIRLHILHRRM